MTGSLSYVDAHQSGRTHPHPRLFSLGLVLVLPGALQSTYILWLLQYTPTFLSVLGYTHLMSSGGPFHRLCPFSILELAAGGAGGMLLDLYQQG